MENPNFYLEGIVRDKNEMQDFEGPLSLILQLLSKNKIEIRDIRISEILDQYLAYLDEMQSMDLEIASEFVQMAAHLLYIKTRTLLAGEEEVSELELLMTSLEQLKARGAFEALQQVLPELKAASERGMLYCAKAPEPLRSRCVKASYSPWTSDAKTSVAFGRFKIALRLIISAAAFACVGNDRESNSRYLRSPASIPILLAK